MTSNNIRGNLKHSRLLSVLLLTFYLCTAVTALANPAAPNNLPTADSALFQSGLGAQRLADLGFPTAYPALASC